MHVEPIANRNRANVTFETCDERVVLGSHAPFLSAEFAKQLLYRGFLSYRERDFPMTVSLSNKVLGGTLGSMALDLERSEHEPPGSEYYQGLRATRRDIANNLTDYLVAEWPSLIAPVLTVAATPEIIATEPTTRATFTCYLQ
jgi:hypothetical protein